MAQGRIMYVVILAVALWTVCSHWAKAEGCPEYRYGRDCQLTCGHCHGDAMCNQTDGRCPGACVPGFRGPNCDQACDPFTYGLDCQYKCLHCRHFRPCNVVTGTCSTGCQPGRTGERCDIVCQNNTFGIDCTEICGECAGNQSCHMANGYCTLGCKPGWTGKKCQQPCRAGHYGGRCIQMCGHCKIGACHPATGHCMSGCASGWSGLTCKQACQPGRHGEGCVKKCGRCANMACDTVTGLCTQGCQTGWQGLRCQQRQMRQNLKDIGTNPPWQKGVVRHPQTDGRNCLQNQYQCSNGFYGEGCKLACGQCAGTKVCNVTSGICPKGCRKGWTGSHCTQRTSSGITEASDPRSGQKKKPSAVPLLIVCIIVLFLALFSTVIYFVIIRPRRMDIATRLHRLTSARSQEGEIHIYEQIQAGPWEINKSNLILTTEKLGHGQFGQVKKAYIKNDHGPNKSVAVKSLKVSASEKDKTDFMNELAILKKVGHHPNVVCLVGSCHIAGTLYVAMEFCSNGDLRTYLRRSRKAKKNLYTNVQGFAPMPQSVLLQFALDVASGMRHLADRQIIHRDLAARNVLLDDSTVAKVADFGLSKNDETYIKTSHTRVPVRWLALESLFNNTYSTQSDVWSFGVLLWEIVTFGGTPYHGMDTQQFCNLLKQGYRLRRPRHCEAALYAMMLQCWLEEPQCRPTFEDLQLRLQRMLEDTQIYMNIEEEQQYSEVDKN